VAVSQKYEELSSYSQKTSTLVVGIQDNAAADAEEEVAAK
jgi:hypothetical protein